MKLTLACLLGVATSLRIRQDNADSTMPPHPTNTGGPDGSDGTWTDHPEGSDGPTDGSDGPGPDGTGPHGPGPDGPQDDDDMPSEEVCTALGDLKEQYGPVDFTTETWWDDVQEVISGDHPEVTKYDFCETYHICDAIAECLAADDTEACFDGPHGDDPCAGF